ncbi:GNAT family N-acetyltransferase [Arthrobacter sp. MYb213]|uniref:GNAT family N-acetyltransferase n=1 Tax=Arthrobacter sp. MYb213 TaxID=1848595 RepID=UPI000CFD0802|nr:GNAT family N-acetyltransferase [Arthrobacter sp. MYb213]PRB72568.1 GNAT family N-acetyltransferase [Arthrobacter sp. MYb213]
MDYELRAPLPKDAAALAELHVHCWKETYAKQLPDDYFTEEHLVSWRQLWERLTQDEDRNLRRVVAEGSKGFLGFALAGGKPGGELQLFSLYVVSSNHGTGLGQQLFNAVLGLQPASLWVAQNNPRATAFYRRNGFEFDGAQKVDPKTPGLTELRMFRT